MTTIEQDLQMRIKYCPVCGDYNDITYSHQTDQGGEFTCNNCHNDVEVYVYTGQKRIREETEDESEEGHVMGYAVASIVILIAVFYFFV